MNTHRKILITGGAGFIGNHLFHLFNQQGYFVYRLDITDNIEYSKTNASDKSAIENILSQLRPDVVIHCAAIKNLPECEEYKLEAFKSNVLSTEHLVNLSKTYPFKLIYISSDVVFDGKQGNYKTSDPVNPINWYGKTKVFSETIIRNMDNYAICRTALVIGNLDSKYKQLLAEEINNPVLVNQTLLPQYIFHRLTNNLPVELPSIYRSNPTPVEMLGEILQKIISTDSRGLFNTSGVNPVSRIEFAQIIADCFNFDSSLIRVNDSNVSFLRPKDITLDVSDTIKSLELNRNEWDLKSYLKRKELYE